MKPEETTTIKISRTLLKKMANLRKTKHSYSEVIEELFDFWSFNRVK